MEAGGTGGGAGKGKEGGVDENINLRKGGSGKSAIVTLLANEARNRGYRVVVVDSDESNLGLYRMLGFDRAK
jgi:CO dehydrogenase nickel-insertion accessory protein CooC1